MVISYHGGECFKVSFGDTTLAFNPISKESKLKSTRFGSDIALVSLQHPDMNGTDQVAHGDREPFVIDGPGEYEIKGTFIKGFPTSSDYGLSKGESGEGRNTMYLVELEGMHLCFLGALSKKELPKEAVAAMDVVDVLFMPIGDDGVLAPADAHALSVELEPSLVIPMHYPTKAAGAIGVKDALTRFLKEEGVSPTPLDKLTLKKKDIEGKTGDVVVLAD